MKKLCKIIAIPIQKEINFNDIIKSNTQNLFLYRNEEQWQLIKSKDWTPQQLLLLSDEEIKEGDYWIYINPKKWNLPQEGITKNNLPKEWFNKLWDRLNYFKIIASYPQLGNLPTFSKEFIQEWCNNSVEEILVEYDKESTNLYTKQFLKLTSNNEVTCSISKPNSKKSQYIRNEDDTYDCLTCGTKGIERNARATEFTPCKCLESHLDQVVDQMNADKEIEEAAEERILAPQGVFTSTTPQSQPHSSKRLPRSPNPESIPHKRAIRAKTYLESKIPKRSC